jgi:hypothetical protein
MARISTYPIDTVVTARDKWIGTDSAGTITKNFTAEGVAAYLNSSGVLDSTGTKYKFQRTTNLSSGGLALSPDNGDFVSFQSVSNITISINDLEEKLVSSMYVPLVGSRVLFTKASNSSTFGVFDWVSASENQNNSSYYDVVLSYVGGNGAFEDNELYFLSLLQLDSLDSNDKHYTHVQGVAASTWTVNHNLDKYPSATMVLSTGQKGYGDVTYIDENTLTITFASAESGKAYIN